MWRTKRFSRARYVKLFNDVGLPFGIFVTRPHQTVCRRYSMFSKKYRNLEGAV